MPWWAWMMLGLVLVALELLSGSLFLLFPGVAAVAVGLLALAGLGPDWLQWLLFAIFSLAAAGLLRRPLIARLSPKSDSRDIDALVGETAILVSTVPVGGVGKAEMRGTAWNVRNAGSEPLAAGQRVRVERVQGLLLWVAGEES